MASRALELDVLLASGAEPGGDADEAPREPPAPASPSPQILRRLAVGLVASSALLLLCMVFAGRGGASAQGGSSGARAFRAEGVVKEAESPFADEPCLCVFDVDRTLTGKQGWSKKCPDDVEKQGVWDSAYDQGTLLLSKLAENLDSTFCKKCYRGIVTAGRASGDHSKERHELLKALGGTKYTRSDWWQDIGFNMGTEIRSSMVVQAADGSKQKAVLSMLHWWKEVQHLHIKKHNVHFFDDRVSNVQPFEGTGINARQVSCRVRGPNKGQIGGCGGEPEELVEQTGVHVC